MLKGYEWVAMFGGVVFISGFTGMLLGATNGRAALGAVLGLCLGPLGVALASRLEPPRRFPSL